MSRSKADSGDLRDIADRSYKIRMRPGRDPGLFYRKSDHAIIRLRSKEVRENEREEGLL